MFSFVKQSFSVVFYVKYYKKKKLVSVGDRVKVFLRFWRNFGGALSGILVDSLYPERQTLQLKQAPCVE